MYNFEHEIETVKDRYLRHFFWHDHFHDGEIHKINILNDNDIELIISSERLWEEEFKKGISLEKFDEKYKYKCIFKNCKHFNTEISDNSYIYINGRFKDSAIVNELNDTSRTKCLHLRIQTTGGYIDIIFSKFIIKNEAIKINIPKKISINNNFEDLLKNKFNNKEIGTIRDLAANGDEIDMMFALTYLGYIKDSSVIELSKRSLKIEDAQIPAFWILGNLANMDVLPLLFDEWKKSKGLLKRHIQDAIEKIIYRNSKVL